MGRREDEVGTQRGIAAGLAEHQLAQPIAVLGQVAHLVEHRRARDVQHAAEAGVPRSYAWRVAFGIAVTMVWLYVEILRILMILRSGD